MTSSEPVACSLCETTVFPIVSVQEDGEKRICQGCVTAAALANDTVKVGRKKA